MPKKKNPKDAGYLVAASQIVLSKAILVSVHLGGFLMKRDPLRTDAENLVKAARSLHENLKKEFPDSN